MPRKYEKVIELLPIVKELTSQGKTQPQIADELGLSDKKVVWNLLYRERQKEVQGVPRFRGRKPAKTLQEYKYENKRLKMENGRKQYRNYGEHLHRYPNLLNRNFYAEKPNQKWVTDISYIHTKQGVLYLSVIRDLYDNSVVAYQTGTEQNINLVLSTIKTAKHKEKVTTEV